MERGTNMNKILSIVYGILLSIIAFLYDIGLYFADREANRTYVTVPSLLYHTIVFAAVVFLFTSIMLRVIKFSSGYFAALISAILCLIISTRIFMNCSLPSLCLIGMSVAFLIFGRKSRESSEF